MDRHDPDSQTAYRDMLRVARRITSSEVEARDLVQDAVMAALERGIYDWPSSMHRAWLHGVLRRRWAFLARTSARRRRREHRSSAHVSQWKGWTWKPRFLSALPPSLRTVASLACADLSAEEIRWLLDLSPTAFRARLSALSRRVRGESDAPVDDRATYPEPLGARRAPVLNQLKKLPNRALATHDPDGHILFFRAPAHKRGPDGN